LYLNDVQVVADVSC